MHEAAVLKRKLDEAVRLDNELNNHCGHPPGVSSYLRPPKLPPDFKPRADVITALGDALFSRGGDDDDASAAAVVVSLQGEGGLGKTVLASACVTTECPSVSVFWITVGSTPSLTSLQTSLARALLTRRSAGSVKMPVIEDVGSGKAALQTLLRDYGADNGQVLVVLDDVWDKRHASAFIGEEGSFLVTTRIRGLLGASTREFPLSKLTYSEAVHLLGAESSVEGPGSDGEDEDEDEDEDEAAALRQIVELCDHLPLALSILGAHRESVPSAGWSELLAQLQAVSIAEGDLLPSESSAVHRALALSVSSLETDLSAFYSAWAVFPEDVVFPVEAAARLHPDGISAGKSAARILCARKLCAVETLDGGEPALKLHDLQLDFVKRRCGGGDAVAACHRVLLRSYATDCCCEAIDDNDDGFFTSPAMPWWRCPDDQYIHTHLFWHFWGGHRHSPQRAAAACRRLLVNFAWVSAKLIATAGDVGGLLADYRSFFSQQQSAGATDDSAVKVIAEAIGLGSHVFAEDPRQLALQLAGRLPQGKGETEVDLMAQHARTALESGTLGIDDSLSVSLTPPAAPCSTFLTKCGGALKRTLTSHTDWVRTLSVSEALLLSGSNDATVKLFDLCSGALLADLRGHEGSVIASSFAGGVGEKCRAVTAAEDNTIRLWDLHDLADVVCTKTIRLGEPRQKDSSLADDAIRSLASLSSSAGDGGDALHFAVAFGSNVHICDMSTGGEIAKLRGHEGVVNCVATNVAHGRPVKRVVLVSGAGDGTVISWSLHDRTPLVRFSGPSEEIRGVDVSADGKTIVGGGFDNKVYVWSPKEKAPVTVLVGHRDWVHSVAVSADGKRVVSGGDDDTLRVWSTDGGGAATRVLKTYSGTFSTALSPDATCAVSASGEIKQWAIGDGAAAAPEANAGEQRHHKNAVNFHGVALSSDGKSCASCAVDGWTKLWDVDSESIVASAWCGEGEALAGEDSDDSDLGSRELPRSVDISADGTVVAVGCDEGTVLVFSVDRPAPALEETQRVALHEDVIHDIRLFQVGGALLVVTACDDRTLKVMNAATGALLRQLTGHSSMVTCVCVAEASPLSVSGDFGGGLRLWRSLGEEMPEDGEPLPSTAASGRVTDVAIDAEASRACAVTVDALIRVFDLVQGSLLFSIHSGSEWTTRGFSLGLSACGGLSLSATWDRQLQLCDLRSGSKRATVRFDKSPVCLAVQRTWSRTFSAVAAIGDDEGNVHFLRVVTTAREEGVKTTPAGLL